MKTYEDSCRLAVIYESKSSDSKQCKAFSTSRMQGLCYSSTAVQSETPSLCLKAAKIIGTEGGDVFNECFAAIASKKKDINLCMQIRQYLDEEYTRSLCPGCSEENMVQVCLLSYARQAKDPEACELVGAQKDTCYQQLAAILQDESHCAKISKETRANSGTLHDSCFEEIAVQKKNRQICDNIESIDIPSSANLGPIAAMMPSDPLYRRKACYDAVDRASGLAPAPTAGPVSNWNFNPAT